MQTLLLILFLLSISSAQAQIGWTLDQCRKHWGPPSDVEHDHLTTIYIFGSASKIEKRVILDQQGKVQDVLYLTHFEDNDDETLDPEIAALLAIEEGIAWETDPDQSLTSRHHYWIGKKDGVILFHARYFTGHDKEATRWAESLHVLPIDSPF
jgi:hypothetical protein